MRDLLGDPWSDLNLITPEEQRQSFYRSTAIKQESIEVNYLYTMTFNALKRATTFVRLLNNDSHCVKNNLRILTIGQPALSKKEVEVTFIKANGGKIKAKGKVGDSLLDVVVNNNLDLDGFGACEGTLTCSTCHLIFSKSTYDALPNKPSEEELDMLDLAYDLCDTSRLGCQIILTEDFDGLQVLVPATINDARS